MPTPPPITRALLIAMTVLLFMAQVPTLKIELATWLALTPIGSGAFWPWQMITYPFVHLDVMQWFVNCLALYMFGAQLEELWGAKRFCQFLAASALTAAVVYLVLTLVFPVAIPLAGAGGAVFGMLLAFAILFPHRRILLFFVADMTMRNAVLVFIAIEVFIMLGDIAGSGATWVANLSQLGGMIGAWLVILWWRHRPPSYRRSTLRRFK